MDFNERRMVVQARVLLVELEGEWKTFIIPTSLSPAELRRATSELLDY